MHGSWESILNTPNRNPNALVCHDVVDGERREHIVRVCIDEYDVAWNFGGVDGDTRRVLGFLELLVELWDGKGKVSHKCGKKRCGCVS